MSSPSVTNQGPANIPQVQVNEYKLDGGATVRDKTNGVARVSFCEDLTKELGQSAYRLLINDKKLIYPIYSRPSDGELIFVGSKKITIKATDTLFKISEVDSSSRNVFYVDTTNDVKGVAYDTYNYIPKDITEEEAKLKFRHLKEEYPDFKADIVAYNRHGVGVFGFEDSKGYVLYWANPSEEKVQPIECAEAVRYRDGGTSIAKSNDGFVNFRYLAQDGNCYINAELATRIGIGR